MAEYGVPEDLDGLLPWEWALERLQSSRNYWVTTVSRRGRPHSLPVWGVWGAWGKNEFWFSCAAGSRKARNIAENPRVVVAIDSTVEVVSIEGAASLVGAGAAVDAVIDEYLAKYASESQPAAELAPFLRQHPFHRVEPERGFGIIERAEEFSTRATRWRWVAG